MMWKKLTPNEARVMNIIGEVEGRTCILISHRVSALAGVPDRPIRLFVSKPSYIQDQAHINALHRVYEGACFQTFGPLTVASNLSSESLRATRSN